MIVIDSDVLIEILDKKSEKGEEALKQILQSGEEIATTAINLHEVLYGLDKYGKPVKELLLLPILNFTKKKTLPSRAKSNEKRKKKVIQYVELTP